MNSSPPDRREYWKIYRTASSDPQTLVHVYYEAQTLRVKRIVLDLRRGAPAR